MQQALACSFMQKVHIDLTGLHVTSRHGNKYILTAICVFTKYLIAVQIREKTSITVARALVRHVYLVHGTAEVLAHDQGGEFWSLVMKELAQLLDIQVSMITSHRPQSNGVVERVHQTMHTVFAKIVSSNQRDWCELTSHVCFAYNTAVHASSTYSPYYLLHLRHPKTPLELLIEKPTAAAAQSNDEYVQQTAERMRQTYAVVREHLKASFDRNKRRYDSRVKSSHFDVGDFVYYYVPKNHYGKNRKWAMDNRGPYRVERRVNQMNYVIRRSPAAAPIIVYIDRLWRYYLQKEADGVTDKLPSVWRSHSTATRPTSAVAARPQTDVSDGLNTGEVGTETPPPDRIPGTAVSSGPPTTAVTIDATAARGQRTRAQEPYRFEETIERLDHDGGRSADRS